MLDLRKIPAAVINIPTSVSRRSHIEKHFGAIGLKYTFVDGVTGAGKIRGCARSHSAAFDTIGSAPFMVFEDDVELVWEAPILPYVPQDADAIYLGTNTGGCFPNTIDNKERFGHRSLAGFALATEFDNLYLRLHSMVSAHAILFLNDAARHLYRENLRIADKRKTPLDVRYAYLMSKLQVYGLREPMFVESQDLQTGNKKSAARGEITRKPLTASRPGDIKIGVKRGQRVTACVVETTAGRLEWSVVDLEPIENT